MSLPATGIDLLVHGTALALGEKAVLIRGPSGAGKSDLALRCLAVAPLANIASPVAAELVADDQVRLRLTESGIEASSPPAIAGKIEVRGLGILDLPYRPAALLVLVVDLVAPGEIERFPLESRTAEYCGIAVPALRLAAFEASAPVKLILALGMARGVLTPP